MKKVLFALLVLPFTPNIAAAQAALRQARENFLAQTGATLLPSVDAQLGATREKLNGIAFGQPGVVDEFKLYNASVNVSYKLDLFGRAIPPERQLEEVLADEDHLLRRREDPQLPGPAELECELAEDLVAEPVEGPDDRIVQPDRGVDVDALLHLGCGALGEGHGQDLVRLRRARRDEMDDPRGQHMGLPRPSTGDNEERPGTVFDREPLLRLKTLQDVRPRLAKSKAELFCHVSWTKRLGPTEGPRAVGHRPKAGGSAAA